MNLPIIIGSIILFVTVYFLLRCLPLKDKLLGKDRGKKFVQGSNVNVGKPTGVGIYFMSSFLLFALLFSLNSIGYLLIIPVIAIEMLSGYFDDISAAPWGEYIKGFLDFIISAIAALVFVFNFDTEIILVYSGNSFELNPIIYFVLAFILMIVSINATNATDGVDGLSGTLSVLTTASFMLIAHLRGTLTALGFVWGLFFIIVLIAYIIFNHYPSKMLMGDAGSRAIGIFIALYAMLLKIPFMYLIIGLPFLLDGGISILKITIGRITDKVFHKKILILKNIRTPLHDHLKKEMKFSAPKTMIIISIAALIIDTLAISILFAVK